MKMLLLIISFFFFATSFGQKVDVFDENHKIIMLQATEAEVEDIIIKYRNRQLYIQKLIWNDTDGAFDIYECPFMWKN